MRIGYIKSVTVLSLIVISLLQVTWLCKTYSLFQDDVVNKSYRILQDAVTLEAVYRLQRIEQDSSGPKEFILGAVEEGGELKDQTLAFQEVLLELKYPISIIVLDSIFTSKLNKEEIHTDFVLNCINVKDKSVLQSTDSLWKSNWASVEIPVVPVRMDGSEGIQAILLNPYWTIFRRLGLLLIATALMMLFVAACIIYQIRIIARQNRIAKMRKDFSSAMIHDMKTPLSSIQMGIRILQSGKLEDKPEKKEKHFRIIEEEAEHLLDLTNKVLTISKMETGKLDLNKEQFDITPLLLDLKEKFIAKTKKSVIFAIDVQNKNIWGDKEYLKEAVSNLIDNAIKYSGETVHIDMREHIL